MRYLPDCCETDAATVADGGKLALPLRSVDSSILSPVVDGCACGSCCRINGIGGRGGLSTNVDADDADTETKLADC